jgi:uncharacterized protein YodC (DUF2158 family)
LFVAGISLEALAEDATTASRKRKLTAEVVYLEKVSEAVLDYLPTTFLKRSYVAEKYNRLMTRFYPFTKGVAMSNDNFPFPVGTVVRLKSGGPNMTYESFGIQYDDVVETAKCVFFNAQGERRDEYIHPMLLEKVDPRK